MKQKRKSGTMPSSTSSNSKSKKSKSLSTLVKLYLEKKELASIAYKESDEILEEIVSQMSPGETLKLKDGRTIVLTDLFADKNVCFKASPFRRFEVQELSADGKVKRKVSCAKDISK